MRTRPNDLLPAKYAARPLPYRLSAALWFAAFAWPWAAVLGGYIGFGTYFILGRYFWYTVLVFSASTFAGAFAAHLILGGYRGLVRCAMSGGASPWFATLFGAILTGWGMWGSSSIHEFAAIAPLFTLPGIIFSAAYWGLYALVLKKQRAYYS